MREGGPGRGEGNSSPEGFLLPSPGSPPLPSPPKRNQHHAPRLFWRFDLLRLRRAPRRGLGGADDPDAGDPAFAGRGDERGSQRQHHGRRPAAHEVGRGTPPARCGLRPVRPERRQLLVQAGGPPDGRFQDLPRQHGRNHPAGLPGRGGHRVPRHQPPPRNPIGHSGSRPLPPQRRGLQRRAARNLRGHARAGPHRHGAPYP